MALPAQWTFPSPDACVVTGCRDTWTWDRRSQHGPHDEPTWRSIVSDLMSIRVSLDPSSAFFCEKNIALQCFFARQPSGLPVETRFVVSLSFLLTYLLPSIICDIVYCAISLAIFAPNCSCLYQLITAEITSFQTSPWSLILKIKFISTFRPNDAQTRRQMSIIFLFVEILRDVCRPSRRGDATGRQLNGSRVPCRGFNDDDRTQHTARYVHGRTSRLAFLREFCSIVATSHVKHSSSATALSAFVITRIAQHAGLDRKLVVRTTASILHINENKLECAHSVDMQIHNDSILVALCQLSSDSDQRFSFYHADILIHTHRDKVIAISALP